MKNRKKIKIKNVEFDRMKCYFVFGVIYITRLQPIESRNQLCRLTESQSIDYPKKIKSTSNRNNNPTLTQTLSCLSLVYFTKVFAVKV